MTDTERTDSHVAFDERCRALYAAEHLSSTRPNTKAAELRCARLAREADRLFERELENAR